MRLCAILVFAFCSFFTRVECYNQEILEKIIQRYHQSESDALRIEVDGEVILSLGKEEPIETMSITKSIANLAIGILVDEGKIPSIHTPIAAIFPEWDTDEKREITLHHVLSHTTGLADYASVEELYLTPDLVGNALESEQTHGAGEHFFYNNRMVNLLSGIVEKVSGKRLDLFVEEKLFVPLGITSYGWKLDFVGQAIGTCGLELTAEGLAKIGNLILNKGLHEGKQLISAEWLAQSFEASQSYNITCGLLWWLDREQKGSWPYSLIEEYEKAGISEVSIAKLKALGEEAVEMRTDKMISIFGNIGEYLQFVEEVRKSGLEFCVVETGGVRGYRADGYLGQYLLIIPKYNTVAVRQIEFGKKMEGETDEFHDFVDLVHKLHGEIE